MPGYPYRNTLPIGELRDRNTTSRKERAVERRREQEGTDKPKGSKSG